MSSFIKTNITNIGDPFVILVENTYYMYATSSPKGFKVWSSNDLNTWQDLGLAYEISEDSFGYQDFWAPEVIFHKGKYVMHYTAKSKKLDGLRIGVAVSDNPYGPFVDVFPKEHMFEFGYAIIDAHVFIDDDNQAYMYYAKDCSVNIIDGIHTSQIYVVKLNDDLTSVISDPIFLLTPTQEWETSISNEWQWNEGPYMLKNNGIYYLTYSGNCFDNKNYGVGFATSDNPMGSFVKYENNPILKFKEGVMSGPGHHCFFEDKQGKLKAAFHIHSNYDKPSGDRRPCFCDIVIENNIIKFDI